ncbi:hypothetical protein [Novosphingobium sp. NDB2Meth1]|uniref:hypothetical protein n=1 Tax=Novosphingobium sp. NDB2Meth1 TaxID=1892847 RepID=UPI000930BDB8|nr:hypothetical protein [Novosphingobium sp. NDB2Meth1]
MSGRSILQADMHTVGQWIADGMRWWLDQLAAMVPGRLREWQESRRIFADYEPDTGALLARPDPSGAAPRRSGPVTIILPPAYCLSRTIERPTMSSRDMESMIQLDAARIMPLGTEGMILAARIAARAEGHARMQIEVAAMPRASAEALGVAIARLEQPCHAILIAAPEPQSGHAIDFLPAFRKAGLVRDADRGALPLWIAVGVLFALNLGLLVWRDTAATAMFEARIAEQQPAVNAVRRINARIAKADQFAAATVKARSEGEPLAMLSRVAAALPPGAWVQRYTWVANGQADGQANDLRITGYRPQQADVAGGLRRAGLSVQRYSDASTAAQNPLGQPFEVTLRMTKP